MSIECKKYLKGINFEMNSKYKPPPISIINSGYPHTKDEISEINLSRSKITI